MNTLVDLVRNFLIAAAAAFALSGCATLGTPDGTALQLREAQSTLSNFMSDPQMDGFRRALPSAHGVIISAGVKRVGFVLGVSHGDAVMFAKDRSGRWVGPAFYSMGGASVGAQVGIDKSEVVVLLMSEKAVESLRESSKMKFGGDASLARGPVGAGSGGAINTDMISFARSMGAYIGLSLEGTLVSPSHASNSAYYGKEVTPAEILASRGIASPGAAPLVNALEAVSR